MNRKLFLIIFLTIVCGLLYAEFVKKPNSNILWLENGEDIKVSKKNSANGWNDSSLKITPLTSGKGFRIANIDRKKYMSGRYVSVLPEYPWLVYEISGFEQLKGYRGFCWGFPAFGVSYGIVGNLQNGIFCINIYENPQKTTTRKLQFLRYDQHGLKVDYKYLKMVSKPDYFIMVDSAQLKKKKSLDSGDKIVFKVYLKEAAEDVSLRFFDTYCMRQLYLNGQDKLQLKPEDDTAVVWSAEVELKKLGRKQSYKPRSLVMKATILGGKMKVPIWGYISYPIKNNTMRVP